MEDYQTISFKNMGCSLVSNTENKPVTSLEENEFWQSQRVLAELNRQEKEDSDEAET